MHSTGIYDEKEFSEGITHSFDQYGYAHLHNKHIIMGGAQDWGSRHAVAIHSEFITPKRFWRGTYKTKAGANRGLLFHAKRLIQKYGVKPQPGHTD
jgi:hypothetical protein